MINWLGFGLILDIEIYKLYSEGAFHPGQGLIIGLAGRPDEYLGKTSLAVELSLRKHVPNTTHRNPVLHSF